MEMEGENVLGMRMGKYLNIRAAVLGIWYWNDRREACTNKEDMSQVLWHSRKFFSNLAILNTYQELEINFCGKAICFH